MYDHIVSLGGAGTGVLSMVAALQPLHPSYASYASTLLMYMTLQPRKNASPCFSMNLSSWYSSHCSNATFKYPSKHTSTPVDIARYVIT